MTSLPRMNIIVAVDDCGGIGRNGKLPWRLPQEMARFSKLTSTTVDRRKINAVIMGRKVWQSIPAKFRPLKNRLNVVLSRTMETVADENVVLARSFENATKMLQSMEDIETIWNIGGREVYSLGLQSPILHQANLFFKNTVSSFRLSLLKQVTKFLQLYITRVEGDFSADVFFPSLNYIRFTKDESSEMHTENGINYRYEIYTIKTNDVSIS
ncbi:unnamed protein product [Thelazia callipaeda]|uniref:dihydrofolate reductase n=1 Tax=Thelazia callipaeda TaxID=103827 RepID=A0A0N5D0M5_THECL|nr:unnamed protein product [Thelazia callipaeda]